MIGALHAYTGFTDSEDIKMNALAKVNRLTIAVFQLFKTLLIKKIRIRFPKKS